MSSLRVAGVRGCWPTLALTLAVCLPTNPALAHDTWFAPLPAAGGGAVVLALGTGNRFPVQEFTMTLAQLQQSGCRAADKAVVPLQRLADTPTALHLRLAQSPPASRKDVRAGYSCWAQSVPFDIELPADKVAIYLKEINASPTVRAAWADMQSRGLPWKERYTKHARIELAPLDSSSAAAAPAPLLASGMALDVLLQSGHQALRAGDELRAQVLRDGQPLADLAVELQSDRSPLGLWQRTDAEGRVRFKLPLAGRWVLRGTDLRSSASEPYTWESRFVTLAFDVAPKDVAALAVRTAAP
jgi:hypothetical protein